ncbi:alpha/beta fold hydrolase [Streptomyces melanosporofaciens]
MNQHPIEMVTTNDLDIAYERHGRPGAPPVILLHGFPYDVRSYDEVARILAAADAEVFVPYLRGFGPTRFRRPTTIRSGQQTALAGDLIAMIEALDLNRPVVAGYDWGGRAATITAMLRPDLITGLVSVDGYNVHDLANSDAPTPPDQERKLWYNYYLHSERGRRGLEQHREAFARLLWEEWSPGWDFTNKEFAATAPSLHNPDFVAVAVHSYRHRFQLATGAAEYQADEDRIAPLPQIQVPTIAISALDDGLRAPKLTAEHASHFPNLIDDVRLRVGHNPPQEAPDEFANTVARIRFTHRNTPKMPLTS